MPGLVDIAPLHLIRLSLALEQALHLCQFVPAVVRVGDGLDVELLQLRRRIADDAGAGVVGLEKATVEPHDGHALAGRLECGSEHRIAIACVPVRVLRAPESRHWPPRYPSAMGKHRFNTRGHFSGRQTTFPP